MAGRGVFDGIGQQVEQHLLQLVRVEETVGFLRLEVHPEVDVFLLCQQGEVGPPDMANERGHVIFHVFAVFNLINGTGLTGYGVSGYLKTRSRTAAMHCCHHHGAHLSGNFRTINLLANCRVILLHQCQRNHVSIAGKHRVGLRDLHQRS